MNIFVLTTTRMQDLGQSSRSRSAHRAPGYALLSRPSLGRPDLLTHAGTDYLTIHDLIY
jgi:hypothetical protein